MDKNTRASESANQADFAECLKMIIGVMKRLPVLKHWDEAKRRGEVTSPADLVIFFDDACMDSMLLTIRAFDDFYRLRKEQPKGGTHLKKAQKDDLYAEQYGFVHASQSCQKTGEKP